MPTPAEKKALVFLAGVALLGGAVRLLRSGPVRPLPAEDLAALDRQLAAADSAAAGRRAAGGGRRERGARPPRAPRAPSAAGRDRPSSPAALRPPPDPPAPLDLDRASAAQIEALPGIGPALAHRIVAWRDSAGGLGGPEALDCVSGVGPALLRRLAGRVTFSGGPRQPCVPPHPPAGPPRRRHR